MNTTEMLLEISEYVGGGLLRSKLKKHIEKFGDERRLLEILKIQIISDKVHARESMRIANNTNRMLEEKISNLLGINDLLPPEE